MIRLICSIKPLMLIALLAACNSYNPQKQMSYLTVRTLVGHKGEFIEPFGLAADKQGNIYISDGFKNSIFRFSKDGNLQLITSSLSTPSHIAFDEDGFLVVADSGSHTIKRVNPETGEVTILAGVENKRGYMDGNVEQALFNAPIGVAVLKRKIFVADTYNDKIRVIENGVVRTIAGSDKGFSDGIGDAAKFDTPCGIIVLKDETILIADSGNAALRKILPNGIVSTIAGINKLEFNGDNPDKIESSSISSAETSLRLPMALTVDEDGFIYLIDENSIRKMSPDSAFIETLTSTEMGFKDGDIKTAKFSRPSAILIDKNKDLIISDSDNALVRVITSHEINQEISGKTIESSLLQTLIEDKNLRWCYQPSDRLRDIAGTFGEIRGQIEQNAPNESAWFHNGIDIPGYYGEKAYFVRKEKILSPRAVSNFATLRESLKTSHSTYIHVKLGRDVNDKPFIDERFEFMLDENSKPSDLRIPRGTVFYEGEPIGSLNKMNHVHLSVGKSYVTINPLKFFTFPKLTDTVPPSIEKVFFFDESWNPIKQSDLRGRLRVVVSAFDKVDTNPERRKLGIYFAGYQLIRNQIVLLDRSRNIVFDTLPPANTVGLIYAPGSQSGAEGETRFNYIITNEIGDDGRVNEGFIDTDSLENGSYTLRIQVGDVFGNVTIKEIKFLKK
jgi:hypothetical protein